MFSQERKTLPAVIPADTFQLHGLDANAMTLGHQWDDCSWKTPPLTAWLDPTACDICLAQDAKEEWKKAFRALLPEGHGDTVIVKTVFEESNSR